MLDEADRMLDEFFASQMKEILAQTGNERQAGFSIFAITSKILRILMEHIEIKNSLAYTLKNFSILSIKILKILEVIAKTSFSYIAECSTLLSDTFILGYNVRKSPRPSRGLTQESGENFHLVEYGCSSGTGATVCAY